MPYRPNVDGPREWMVRIREVKDAHEYETLEAAWVAVIEAGFAALEAEPQSDDLLASVDWDAVDGGRRTDGIGALRSALATLHTRGTMETGAFHDLVAEEWDALAESTRRRWTNDVLRQLECVTGTGRGSRRLKWRSE